MTYETGGSSINYLSQLVEEPMNQKEKLFANVSKQRGTK